MSEDNKKQDNFSFGFKLDDFQQKAVDFIDKGKSVVVCAPTGAGKTVIAEHAIIKAIQDNKRIFYTTPLKALSNQKFNDFSKKYREERVGLLTGDISINRNAQIVVMTTEVYRNMLYGTSLGKIEENLNNVQYVVLDEVHYMNEERRGTVWEESIIYSPNAIQLIALSATIANADELTNWINTVHGPTKLVNTDFRPVPLKHYYFPVTPGSKKILSLFAPGGKLNSKIKASNMQVKKSKKLARTEISQKLVNALSDRNMLPAIYFTFSRKGCDENMEACSKLRLLNKFEEKRLMQIIDEYILDNPYIAKSKYLEYLYSGVASHHAGMLPAWKVLVEKLFQQGLIKVVFATETLAAGINMPARSTIISSISKRSDDGHRLLTASEFLQMSGRAGRRGMDEEGFVTVVGSAHETAEEVAELASSIANPLESRFTPGYSMVLNLLQRFDMDETRELILKSFGYFTSSKRLKPFYEEQARLKDTIDGIENYKCIYGLTNEDVKTYNKLKNTFVEYKKITSTLRKQAAKTGRKDAPEVLEYELKTKDFLNQSRQFKCHKCKEYKRHIKSLDVLVRFNRRYSKITKLIDYEKDIYWQQFLNLMEVLEEKGFLQDRYPTQAGVMASSIRADNEVYLSDIVLKGVLDDLSPSELASVICAVSTEDIKNTPFNKYYVNGKVRKAFARCDGIGRSVRKLQKQYNVEVPILMNPVFSSLIENWVMGCEWDDLIEGLDIGEGDIVRVFKRTSDLLRQLMILPGVPEHVIQNAEQAFGSINRDPIIEIY